MNKAMVFAVVLPVACLSGCSALSVADAGVTAAANTVKLGANVVGAVSDVARAGVSVASAGVTVTANAVKVTSTAAGAVSDITNAGVRVITNNAGQNR